MSILNRFKAARGYVQVYHICHPPILQRTTLHQRYPTGSTCEPHPTTAHGSSVESVLWSFPCHLGLQAATSNPPPPSYAIYAAKHTYIADRKLLPQQAIHFYVQPLVSHLHLSPKTYCTAPHTILAYANAVSPRQPSTRRYVAYRVRAEIEYLRQFSATFQYLERTYRWWRHNFPEYIHPSSLPNPPGTPPVQPTWTVAPVAVLLQRIPVWEMQLDNLLLFGHTMPTNAEVEYRRAYLQWCASHAASTSLCISLPWGRREG